MIVVVARGSVNRMSETAITKVSPISASAQLTNERGDGYQEQLFLSC